MHNQHDTLHLRVTESPTVSPNARIKLDAFLVDNHELEALNARLAAFNLFNVLRIERTEIRHSNVLAWMLSPNESHGLGVRFLRRFMSRILMETEGVETHLTPAKVELMELSDVEVLREWQHIDIVVRSRAGKWCVLIENKVDSKESAGQLSRYRDAIQRELPGQDIIPMFLTVDGAGPSDAGLQAGYNSLSYALVLDIADRIVEQNRGRIPSDAARFIDQYLDVLRRITMQDVELIELCKTIYRRHRDAIDMIVEYGASSSVVDACGDWVSKTIVTEFLIRKSASVWFLPTELGSRLPEVRLASWTFLPRQSPVACWFHYDKGPGRLTCCMEVGPIADGAERVRFLRHLQEAGFSLHEKRAFREDARFTRLITATKNLRSNEDGIPDDDPEYIGEVTEGLWKKVWGENEKMLGALDGFDWRLGKSVAPTSLPPSS